MTAAAGRERGETMRNLGGFAGRVLLAVLFVAGTLQKLTSPEQAMALLEGRGLPGALVWPAAAANLMGALCLLTGVWLGPAAIGLALYCAVTSVFHFIPSDGWQMSIFVKNWAISGGLLALAAGGGGDWRWPVRQGGRPGGT